MNRMNDPIPNPSGIDLTTKDAVGVAGKVEGNFIVNNNYNSRNGPTRTQKTCLIIESDSEIYTPEEWAELVDLAGKLTRRIKSGSIRIEYSGLGSIKLFLSGLPEDIAELQRLIKSKELTQIEGHNIAEIQETTPEEDAKISLIQRIKTGEINLRDTDLSGVDLSGINLRGTGASRFYYPHFTSRVASPVEVADLFDVDSPLLKEGTAMRADYLNPNAPREARLLRSKQVSLSGARLREADLFMADLFRADLSGSDLSGSDLRKAYLKEADLSGADLRGADLRGADLSETNLNMSGLVGANLRGANLRGADLSGADLRKANLSEANLHGANLIEANLRQVDLIEADLGAANLRKADLSGACLRKAYLRNAIVFKTYFGHNQGIDEEQKATLLQQGAIFEKGGISIKDEIEKEVYGFQMFLDNAMINRTKMMLMSTASIIVVFVSFAVAVVLLIIRL